MIYNWTHSKLDQNQQSNSMLIYLNFVRDIVRNTNFLVVEEYIFSRKSKIPIFPTGKVFFVHNIKDHLSIKTRSGVIIYVTFEYEYCEKKAI